MPHTYSNLISKYKADAKLLHKLAKNGDIEAKRRVSKYFDYQSLTLQSAQLIIARELGLKSWRELVDRQHQYQDTTEYLRRVFEEQTPEVLQGSVRIRRAARVPGVRSKIAVSAIDPNINPVGACVGHGAERVRAISKILNGEHIDIVLWSSSLKQFVANAFAPAKLELLEIDSNQLVTVSIHKSQLELATGKNEVISTLVSNLCHCELVVEPV